MLEISGIITNFRKFSKYKIRSSIYLHTPYAALSEPHKITLINVFGDNIILLISKAKGQDKHSHPHIAYNQPNQTIISIQNQKLFLWKLETWECRMIKELTRSKKCKSKSSARINIANWGNKIAYCEGEELDKIRILTINYEVNKIINMENIEIEAYSIDSFRHLLFLTSGHLIFSNGNFFNIWEPPSKKTPKYELMGEIAHNDDYLNPVQIVELPSISDPQELIISPFIKWNNKLYEIMRWDGEILIQDDNSYIEIYKGIYLDSMVSNTRNLILNYNSQGLQIKYSQTIHRPYNEESNKLLISLDSHICSVLTRDKEKNCILTIYRIINETSLILKNAWNLNLLGEEEGQQVFLVDLHHDLLLLLIHNTLFYIDISHGIRFMAKGSAQHIILDAHDCLRIYC